MSDTQRLRDETVIGHSAFSADYVSARSRFRQAASRLEWTLEAHGIDVAGPGGEPLTIDVACSPSSSDRVLVISSGVHGVEGFFGSAVQVALLEQWASVAPPSSRCVFLHGVNPFGFAWLRRCDENNVDLNRNFLLENEQFEGAPERYAQLDAFLNPRRPPALWEPFTLKALPLVMRHGMPALRQAIAGGQYNFPRGLFYGGAGPSRTQQLLGEHFPRWLKGSGRVVHLDFHSGLGRRGAWKLLIDYPLREHQRGWLSERFGANSFQTADSRGSSYEARGGFGRWCVSRNLARDYVFAYAEFGTYGPIQMLAGLRAENQAHHWDDPSSASTLRAKARLKELFCPADLRWRSHVLEESVQVAQNALRVLTNA